MNKKPKSGQKQQRGNLPMKSSQRTQEEMDEMGLGPKVKQKVAQKAIEWARPLEALWQKLKTTWEKEGRRSWISEMIDLRSQKGVEIGALIESITILALLSKMIDGSWRLAAKETASRATLTSAQAGEKTNSLAMKTEIICPLESRQTAEGKEALGVMVALKLNLTQLGGGGS